MGTALDSVLLLLGLLSLLLLAPGLLLGPVIRSNVAHVIGQIILASPQRHHVRGYKGMGHILDSDEILWSDSASRPRCEWLRCAYSSVRPRFSLVAN